MNDTEKCMSRHHHPKHLLTTRPSIDPRGAERRSPINWLTAPLQTRHGRRVLAGAAATVLAAGVVAATTQFGTTGSSQNAVASPVGGSAFSAPVLHRAQARATLATARHVVASVNPGTNTAPLQAQITALQQYPSMSVTQIDQHVARTATTTDSVAEQSLSIARQQAAQAAAAAQAQAAAKAQAAAAAAAQAEAARAAAAAAAAQAAADTPSGARALASSMAASRYGWGASQFACLNNLWTKESGWNYRAENPSGAYGIPQALPGTKMSTVAADWQTNASTQIAWGLQYIAAAYGTPCAAWAHSEALNYY